jgi:endo-1,4-beta-xylanase
MKKSPSVKGQLLFLALLFGALALLPIPSSAQIAVGKSKFVGNIINGSPPSNFSTYWNQVTPENAGKWGSVEPSRDVMNWSQLDTIYNYAQQRGYKFKMHTLVWGSQFPSWITSLSQADQRAEIEEWFRLVAQRYPNIWAVDVVNEPVKTPLPFKAALGGDGATGYDWVVTSYRLARQYFPNALLLINEYGTENDPNARNQYLNIVNILRNNGLIDGIGVQAHYFNLDFMSASQMTTALNAYAATGLPVYISELDITGGGSDSGQLQKYQELFPVIWNHPGVKGITLWGYIVGQTWRSGTGLVNSNGTERPAMTWLKNFVVNN